MTEELEPEDESPYIVDPLHDPRYNEDGSAVKPPGPLPTRKRENYCQYRAQGHGKTEAYMRAGYNPQDRQRGGTDALKLERDYPEIKARIHELKIEHGIPFDEVSDARDNPAITPEYVNSQMKLLLVQAKQADQLKLARDIIRDMGQQIGLYLEKPTHEQTNYPSLTAPHNGIGAINIQKLNQRFESSSDRSGDKPSKADVIDIEVVESTD